MRVKNYIGSGSVGVKYKWVAHGASQADQELQKGRGKGGESQDDVSKSETILGPPCLLTLPPFRFLP